MEVPALLFSLDHLSREILPARIGHIRCDVGAVNSDDVRHERIKEPFFIGILAVLFVKETKFSQLLARLDAELDAPVPQHLAGLAVMDLGVHVE
jgi:hypothetical protein